MQKVKILFMNPNKMVARFHLAKLGVERETLRHAVGFFVVPNFLPRHAPTPRKKPYISVMEALRTYITPDGPVLHLTLPEALLNQRLEVIVMPAPAVAAPAALVAQEDAAFYALSGSWQTDETSEELIAMIEGARRV